MPCSGNGGSARVDILSTVLVGPVMSCDQINPKQTKLSMMDVEEECRSRKKGILCVSLSRTSSVSSVRSADSDIKETGGSVKRRKVVEDKEQDSDLTVEPERLSLENVRAERKELEAFLFNEANKVTKAAVKIILDKWASLEAALLAEIMKVERLSATRELHCTKPVNTYAQVVAGGVAPAGAHLKPETVKEKHEVLIIKPENENDPRSNDEIKAKVTEVLKKNRSQIRIKQVRQLRNKGVVVEVKDKRDIEIIKNSKFKEVGLKTAEPKKINPSIIIYDVEKEYKADELKEDLIFKNLEVRDDEYAEKLKRSIDFRHCFKTKNESRVNWIVQLPAKEYSALMLSRKVYMFWRIYKLKEYLNVMRCYKCQGYGHIAKFCQAKQQCCENCGNTEHERKDCPRKDKPQCINCIRTKRKDTNHSVTNKLCPELQRQIDLYRNRINWT
uniref:uncharacterized protein LOC117611536 n=1 Tax=Osmia lignaria TaxID=473952 RepID=UPI001478CCAA|nr:uncharacterized protein LOC117611536 [Osmia lignaria]